jgi:hypothetical protein
MSTAMIRQTLVLLTVAACAGGALGCGDKVREGRSPSYLVIDSVLAASGADTTFQNTLSSDVVTKGIVYADAGQATVTLALKDIGPAGTPSAPTPNNFVTITRYHVSYRRSDGRNTPGVDVPYAFDGASTATVSDSPATFSFVLVRIQAKEEAPLKALVGQGGAFAISTIADVTFYGQDQTGNDVSATGSISVNFADWGDPQ